MQLDNVDAFGKLYDKYAPLLLGFIFKLVCDQKTAEDILQQVFNHIWENRTAYDFSKGGLFTKLIRTARELSGSKTNVNGEISQFNKTVHYDEISKLPHKQNGTEALLNTQKSSKEAFDLIYYRGYSFSEAATVLNIPVDILKEKVKMAISQLRGGETL